MVISKALPIKFWLAGQTTYNGGIDSIAGIQEVLFKQKWVNTDPIVLQFYDTLLKDYRLRAYDEDETLLGEILFTRELLNDLYIYSISTTFETGFEVTTDKVAHLKIIDIQTEISGDVSDLMETADGDLVFVDESQLNNIDGDVTDLMETADGDMVNAQFDYFGSGITTESNACPIDPFPLYWPSGVTWGPGVTMYTDAAMTSPYTTAAYIQLTGEVFNINGSGVVGSSTGIFC
jgi:hypothetical protein